MLFKGLNDFKRETLVSNNSFLLLDQPRSPQSDEHRHFAFSSVSNKKDLNEQMQARFCKDFELVEPDKESERMLQGMIKYYERNMEHIRMKNGSVDKEQVPRMRQELQVIKQELTDLNDKCLVVGAFEEKCDTLKQAFWLNLINFMTLLKLAEI